MIDPKLQAELRAKYNPEGSDLRKAQLIMLSVLKTLDKICREHGLEYWLDSGTLIGAARHGGFIPWDDDIDVCMMKKDAEKLKEIMGDIIWDGHVILQNHNTDPNHYNSSWMTLRDIYSEYVMDEHCHHNKLKYKGFQVDIFIIEEGVSFGLLKFSRNLFNSFIQSPLDGRHHLGFLRGMVPLNYFILTKMVFPIFNLFKQNNEMVSSGYGAIFLKIQKKESIFPLRTIKFENYSFMCPNNYEEYLNNLYGCWKILPPIDNMHSHEVKLKFL